MDYCSSLLSFKYKVLQLALLYSLQCICGFHYVLVTQYSNVTLYCGCELKHLLLTHSNFHVELLIKHEFQWKFGMF